MVAPPGSSTVYNNLAGMHFDTRTPGLNGFISAWQQVQDWTGDGSQRRYNAIITYGAQILEAVQ